MTEKFLFNSSDLGQFCMNDLRFYFIISRLFAVQEEVDFLSSGVWANANH